MLDKYFGFLQIEDEYSVIDSLVDHSRIDEEEILLLSAMVNAMSGDERESIQSNYLKIRKINMDTARHFETISDQIIQANFDHQKQYDLLRLQQRISTISGLIIATAKRILIFYRINADMPDELCPAINELSVHLEKIHKIYREALVCYSKNKKDVIQYIHKVSEEENYIDHLRSECLEIIYKLGNDDKLKMGTLMVLQEVIEHIEDISDAIDEACSSIDWLLLN